MSFSQPLARSQVAGYGMNWPAFFIQSAVAFCASTAATIFSVAGRWCRT